MLSSFTTKMRFSVHHATRYDYSVPVSLGEHVVRLVPQGPQVAVERHELLVTPTPTSQREEIDANGNRMWRLEFAGTTDRLWVDSHTEARTHALPALIDPGFSPLPWSRPRENESVASTVARFAHEMAATSSGVIDFLLRLNRELYQRTDRQIRWDGAAQDAEHTLESARGACRDLTVLFLECCRALGISGRFVSGYQSTADTPDGQRHLHAWPEVFLPGLGFRGFDPTHGLPVNEGHLPLCSAPSQAETMPIEGAYSFLGPELSTNLSFSVQIDTRDA